MSERKPFTGNQKNSQAKDLGRTPLPGSTPGHPGWDLSYHGAGSLPLSFTERERMAPMEIITADNLGKWAFVAQRTREADRIHASEKQQTSDGRPLYWADLVALDLENGQSVDLTAFTLEPLPTKIMDLVEVGQPHLMNVFGGRNGSQPIGMYWFGEASVIANLLDEVRH